MSAPFLTDEHVPSVFITTLRSSGYDVTRAKDELGEGTDDEHLLRYAADRERIFITHDKKDFGGELGRSVDHSGVLISTEPNFLRDHPDEAVRAVERILAQYPREELRGRIAWLEQRRA